MAKTHEWMKVGGLRSSTVGGWFDDPVGQGLNFMNSSYIYRETYQGNDYSKAATTPNRKEML